MKSRIKFLIIITGIIYLFFNYKNLIGPYPIKEVKLKGEFIYVDENKLRKDLNLFIGKDLMTINLIEIKKNVEQNDWIKNSLIMREFPDILAIELLNAAQAIDFKKINTSPILKSFLKSYRKNVPFIQSDRQLNIYINKKLLYINRIISYEEKK